MVGLGRVSGRVTPSEHGEATLRRAARAAIGVTTQLADTHVAGYTYVSLVLCNREDVGARELPD
jgi:hypothetical protein